MSVSPIDFLHTAENSLKSTSEIDHRNAASRAYYSAFHHCGPLANHLDPVATPKSGLHNAFIDIFINSSNFKSKAIGYMLRQCHDLRIKADYHIGDEFHRHEAEITIKQAKRIYEAVDKLK
jgi:uncharacterized protein (UPF0332 family)